MIPPYTEPLGFVVECSTGHGPKVELWNPPQVQDCLLSRYLYVDKPGKAMPTTSPSIDGKPFVKVRIRSRKEEACIHVDEFVDTFAFASRENDSVCWIRVTQLTILRYLAHVKIKSNARCSSSNESGQIVIDLMYVNEKSRTESQTSKGDDPHRDWSYISWKDDLHSQYSSDSSFAYWSRAL